MLDPWLPLLALAGTLLPLLGAYRWITRRLQELSMRWVGDPDVALVLYFVVVLPGVVIHEVSHWLAARAMGVRVTQFSLGPVRKGRSRRVSLGSIRVGKVDAVRAGLIGIAPLVGGSAVILLIGNLVLGVGELAEVGVGQGLDGLLAGLGQVSRTPDFALWLYLIFAVSNAMLPSDSDMSTVRPVFLFLVLITSIVLIAFGLPEIPLRISAAVQSITTYLAYAFGLALAVDLVFMLLIGALTAITRWWQNRPTYTTE